MAEFSTPKFIATVAVPALGALAAAGVWGATVIDRLPANTATHFEFSGIPNDFMSPGMAVFSMLGIGVFVVASLIAAMFASPTTQQGKPARWLAGTAAGMGVFLALLSIETTRANLDLASGTEARLGIEKALLPLLAGLVVGLAVAVLITPAPMPKTSDDRPAGSRGHYGRNIQVPEGATAGWFGYARPGWIVWLLGTGSALSMVVIALLDSSWWIMALTAITVLLLLALTNYKVAINAKGITAGSVLGWPRISIPMSDVVDAEVTDVHFGNWGGWGWRTSGHGTGLITGGSEALRVNRSNGKILEVTCNDPSTAAGVINALKG